MKHLTARVLALASLAIALAVALLVVGVIAVRVEVILGALLVATLVGLIISVRSILGLLLARLGNHDKRARALGRHAVSHGQRLESIAERLDKVEEAALLRPKLLPGDTDLRAAETAARLDWIARRQVEEADRIDASLSELKLALARQQEDLVALRRYLERTSIPEPDPQMDAAGTRP